MEGGTFRLTESVFSFQEMFSEVLNEVRYMASEKHQQFSYDLDPVIPPSLLGDCKRLSQVIINLLANAVKFTPEQGIIHFSACLLGKDNGSVMLKIEVTDNGIGISKEKQSNVFRVFEQGDGSMTRKYGGTGLGLAFSRRVVELMGGKIWVDSELGKGSKFIFTCKIREN
jgi:signal transduction histidine kinase